MFPLPLCIIKLYYPVDSNLIDLNTLFTGLLSLIIALFAVLFERWMVKRKDRKEARESRKSILDNIRNEAFVNIREAAECLLSVSIDQDPAYDITFPILSGAIQNPPAYLYNDMITLGWMYKQTRVLYDAAEYYRINISFCKYENERLQLVGRYRRGINMAGTSYIKMMSKHLTTLKYTVNIEEINKHLVTLSERYRLTQDLEAIITNILNSD